MSCLQVERSRGLGADVQEILKMYGEKEKRILESMHQLEVIENLLIVRYIHKSNEEQVKLTDVVVLSFMAW